MKDWEFAIALTAVISLFTILTSVLYYCGKSDC